MSEFYLYLKLGFNHIITYQAFDHILFITSLVAIYSFSEVKKVLVLVTAFTIGHSLTLALSVLDVINIDLSLVELLISITILITAIANLRKNKQIGGLYRFKYITAAIFGLIHGLGFSGYLKMLLGQNQGVLKPLFAFNIGIELGQILVVLIVLILREIVVVRLDLKNRVWVWGLSVVSILVASILIFSHIFV